jgi:hypothetical protein
MEMVGRSVKAFFVGISLQVQKPIFNESKEKGFSKKLTGYRFFFCFE